MFQISTGLDNLAFGKLSNKALAGWAPSYIIFFKKVAPLALVIWALSYLDLSVMNSIIVPQASCTLEAGVKIYALRVDSVHSEAYKVLGGISRAGLEDQQGLTL